MERFNRRISDKEGLKLCPNSLLDDVWFTLGILEYILNDSDRKLKEVPAFYNNREYFDKCGVSIFYAARRFYDGRDYGRLLCKRKVGEENKGT